MIIKSVDLVHLFPWLVQFVWLRSSDTECGINDKTRAPDRSRAPHLCISQISTSELLIALEWSVDPRRIEWLQIAKRLFLWVSLLVGHSRLHLSLLFPLGSACMTQYSASVRRLVSAANVLMRSPNTILGRPGQSTDRIQASSISSCVFLDSGFGSR